MKKIRLILIISVIASCSSSNKIGKNKSDKEVLKELAFCTCMNDAMKLYFIQDTLDASIQQVDAELETRKITTKIILPAIKENIKKAILQMAPVRGPYVHESVVGMNTYIQGCLSYYNSKQLDSLIKSFRKRDYNAY